MLLCKWWGLGDEGSEELEIADLVILNVIITGASLVNQNPTKCVFSYSQTCSGSIPVKRVVRNTEFHS